MENGAEDVRVAPGLLRALRSELAAVSRRGYERGLVPGVSGNNSLRVPGTELLLIKATDCCQGEMTEAETVLMSLSGDVLDPGRKPSKEWLWHAGIYRARPEVGGIVHLHPPYSVAFAVADEVPMLVHAAARGHLRALDSVDLLPAGSRELADAVVEKFAGTEIRGLVMREHGTVTVGPDVRTAYYRTEYLEDDAKVALLAAQITGGPPRALRLAEDSAPHAEAEG
ncbi:class II aldolase/adducin family protein [Streptomyces sp. HNM0575]|uniref:class II aldolase/adducin family protein n=1 Tax=Streptomyces sp. HNM0575 TaxID=2716338 RepID=UPI00145C53BD|nr:class II aldolase/adducin family protein [Streptomyces sp. HNM0575]NLU72472.1 class II aldolase/adducin family protein [Streptomyces sp. HNM0575]